MDVIVFGGICRSPGPSFRGRVGCEGRISVLIVSPGRTKVSVAIVVVGRRLMLGLRRNYQPCPKWGEILQLALVKFPRLWVKKSSEIHTPESLYPRNANITLLNDLSETIKMAEEGQTTGTAPGERHAIGICFGNSNSSIAYTTVEDKAEVIANEDGGL